MRAERILFLCLYVLPVIFAGDEKNDSVFVPTREWQVVKKGIPISEGLHVRHNLQTGVTEAKLMDDMDDDNTNKNPGQSDSKSILLHPEKATIDADEINASNTAKETKQWKYPLDELKARLKKIKADEAKVTSNSENKDNIPKKKFRDYETLKKELKELEINVTTDSDLLVTFFQEFNSHKNAMTTGILSTSEVEEILDILYNLEYLLHHIDNAKVFTDMQGMSKIISPCLNATNNEIKAEALRLLGAAVQSNPKVQIKALEHDFVQKLLRILSTNNKMEVKSRCLYALSALIRHFPAAQKVFIDHGGVEIFGKILTDAHLQIQLKVMKLINDLIIERQNLQDITDIELRQQKIDAYAVTNIEQKLLMHEYCKHLNNLMLNSFKNEIDNQFTSENYEFFEVISESMINVSSICKSVFYSNKDLLLPIISNLLDFYQKTGADSKTEENIFDDVILLVKKLRTILSEISHDEL